MKAVVIHAHGGVDQLKYEDIETPKIGLGEVLINLKAVGLNHFDLDVRDGVSGYFQLAMPHILGVEGAGVIAEVGEGVTAFKVGDKAMPYLTTSCGHCAHCLAGMDNICMTFDKLGVTSWGTYAEYVKVTQHNVIPLPDGISFIDAAATQVAMATAWEMIVRRAKLVQGETVLINAAGSGVGSAAVQIAKLAGARIIVSAGADEKLERAKQLGADEGINYNTQNLAEAVMALTEERGVDVCIEMVGGGVLQESIVALAHNGRLCTCGAHAGEKVEIDMIEFFRKQITVSSTHFAPKTTNSAVLDLVAQGKLEPVIDSVYPLQEMAAAHEKLASRKFFGKIVLEV